MIEIDKKDFLYKHLINLGVEESDIENEYTYFAKNGITNKKDFNNYLSGFLGEDYYKDLDEETLNLMLPYYKDVKKCKGLSATKIKELLGNYEITHDRDVFEMILTSQLKNVMMLACSYKMQNEELDITDLIQTCNIGLINAIQKYRVKTKLTFKDYIYYYVSKEIRNEFITKEQNDGKD